MEFIRTASDAKLLIILAGIFLILSIPSFFLISAAFGITMALSAACYAVVAWIARGWDF